MLKLIRKLVRKLARALALRSILDLRTSSPKPVLIHLIHLIHRSNPLFSSPPPEVYAQDEHSFEADQENLNSSTSSDRFYQTPSAKFIYEQTNTTKKAPSQNVRQTLFQNLDPLNESNGQNLTQHSTLFNHSLDSSACTERTIIAKQPESHNQTFLSDRSISNEKDNAFLNDAHLMDLSSEQTGPVADGQPSNSQQYEDALREKDQTNEKLTNYIEQLNQLNKHLSDAILAVQDKFEASLNEKNATIQDLNLQNSVLAKEKKLALEDVQGRQKNSREKFSSSENCNRRELIDDRLIVKSIDSQVNRSISKSELSSPTGLENSFSELHRRYEKLKLALESCKKKEEMFQEECLVFSEKLEESQRLNGEYKRRLEILESE